MSLDGATVRLVGEHTRTAACKLVQEAPEGWLVKIGAPPRTLKQTSRFYALCGDVARTSVTWGDEHPDKEGWHDLFLFGFHTLKGRAPRLMLGLEGERMCLSKHIRDLGEADTTELIDYAEAWCVMHGISIRE